MIPTPQPYSNPRATPPPPPPRRRRRTVLIVVAVAVVVLIVAAVGFAVSVFGLNPGFVALIGAVILFGLISFALRFLPQGLPGIRLLRSLVGFVTIAALAGILYFFFVPAAQSGFRSLPELGGPATSAATTPVTVVYDVTGTAPTASITQSPAGDATTGGTGNTGDTAATVQPIPFSRTFTVTGSATTFFSLSASISGDDESTNLSCSITVDGTVIAHDSDSGGFGLVICNGTAKG
jgi:hypothetical protein